MEIKSYSKRLKMEEEIKAKKVFDRFIKEYKDGGIVLKSNLTRIYNNDGSSVHTLTFEFLGDDGAS